MKIKKILCVILSTILIAVCLPICSFAEESSDSDLFVEGEVLFKYEAPLYLCSNSNETEADITDELDKLGISELTELDTFEEECPLVTSSLYSDDLEDGVYLAEIDGDVLETCEKLEKIDGVVYAEPNYTYQVDSFTMPTEVNNTSVYKKYSKWYFDYMHITEAWSKYETAGENVVVAVIDNGFKIDATDFPTNLWDDGNGNCGYNGYEQNNDISPVYDSDGNALNNSAHGSNVAGVIGMLANGSGSVGAAYGAELMLLKCAYYIQGKTSSTISSSAIANCITYAVNNGADIITMSISGYSLSTAVRDAINVAYNNDIPFFAAVGNDAKATSDNLAYPACLEHVIGVMAIGSSVYADDGVTVTGYENTDQLSDFSNYDTSGTHKYYDVAAPGCIIVGCSLTKGNLSCMSGTSQATPLVAACAALYRSAYPDATVEELYEAIKNSPTRYVTTNSKVTTTTYNFKILDALELLDYSEVKPEIVANNETAATLDPTKNYIYGLDEGYADISDYITVTSGTGTVVFTPNANGNGTGSTYTVYDNRGDVYAEYTIIIYGDVNGDGYADGQDAVLIGCMINFPDIYSDYQKYAADVDRDNSVVSDDYSIVANYSIGLDIVTQI